MQLANIKDVNFIVLHGKSNAGKTTTLNELIISLIDKNKNDVGKIEAFEKNFKKVKVNFINNEEVKSYLERIEGGKKQKENKKYDHIYFLKYKEKTILVITEGDDMLKLLGTLVHNFLYNKTDIVVCAAREKFLNDFVKDLLKIGFNIADEDKLEKKKSSEKAKQESDNQEMSEKILEKIDNLIQKSGN